MQPAQICRPSASALRFPASGGEKLASWLVCMTMSRGIGLSPLRSSLPMASVNHLRHPKFQHDYLLDKYLSTC